MILYHDLILHLRLSYVHTYLHQNAKDYFCPFAVFSSFPPPKFKFSFEKLFNCGHKVVEFYLVKKPIIANRFVRYNLHHNITRLAIIKRKRSKENANLKFGGESGI